MGVQQYPFAEHRAVGGDDLPFVGVMVPSRIRMADRDVSKTSDRQTNRLVVSVDEFLSGKISLEAQQALSEVDLIVEEVEGEMELQTPNVSLRGKFKIGKIHVETRVTILIIALTVLIGMGFILLR